MKQAGPFSPAGIWVLLPILVIQCSCSTTPSAGGRTASRDASPSRPITTTAAPESEGPAGPRPIGLIIGDVPPGFDTGQKTGSSVDSQVAVGTLQGAGKGALSCFNVGGGGGKDAALGFAIWLILCEPVAIVVGGTIGGVSAYKSRVDLSVQVPNDLRIAVKASAATAQADLLKALEEVAVSYGIPTVRLSSKYATPSGNVPIKQTVPLETSSTTALEVTVTRIIAIASATTRQADGLGVEARVRVIALPSRKVLDTYTFIRLAKNATVTAVPPTANDFNLGSAYHEIAEAAFEESMLVYRGSEHAELHAAPAGEVQKADGENNPPASAFPGYTLRPLYPPIENLPPPSSDPNSAGASLQRRISDLQPMFRWESMPASFEGPVNGVNAIQDLTYEFKLYRGASKTPYTRSGLATPMYSLDTPLAPCEIYAWTVRASFILNGRPRVTEWTGMYNGVALPAESFGAPAPGLPAFDPAQYRRVTFARWDVDQRDATIYYPHFRTADASGSGTCPGDWTTPLGTTQTAAKTPAAVAVSTVNAPKGTADAQIALASTSPRGMDPPATNPALPKVGDSWTYNVLNGGHLVDTLTIAIAGSSATQITETLTRGRSKDFKAERVFSVTFDPLTGFQESELPGRYFLAEFSPYAAPAPGDLAREWSGIHANLTLNLSAKLREEWRLNAKVRGTEHIRVPAGEFEAVKVEVLSNTHRWADMGDGFMRLDFWYAPDVKRTVKMVRRFETSKVINAYVDTYELASYQLH